MPTNKPMQVQWREIDGRLVPFTLPQHWNGSNWVITGIDNPLPTADYGMTQGGLWIPKKVSDDGAQHTQLTGSIVEIARTLNFEVSPNSNATAIYDTSVSDFRKIMIAVRTDASHNWRAHIQSYVSGDITFGTAVSFSNQTEFDVIVSEGNATGVSGPIDFYTEILRVIIKNDDTINHNYDVFLYGVR